jgi:fatty acid desaturase
MDIADDTGSPGGVYFCESGTNFRRTTRKDLSVAQRKTILALHTLDRRWNAFILVPLTCWLVGGWIAVASELTLINIAGYLIAGLGLSTLTVLMHESSHNLFTRHHHIDQWIGAACGLPLMVSTFGYRKRHAEHHKHTRTDGDPDDIEVFGKHPRALLAAYAVLFFLGGYAFLVDVPLRAMRSTSPAERRMMIIEASLLIMVHTTAWLLIPTHIMLEGWLIPLLVAVQIANIRGVAEHGMTTAGNEFINTRTVRTNPVMSLLMCNVNYHVEHHLFPGVPWYNLPRLHEVLAPEYRKAGTSVYSSYTSFIMDFGRVLWRSPVAGWRLVPRYLRDEGCL